MNEAKNNNGTSATLASEQYKRHMAEIAKSIQNLDSFTNNMESKVDGILKAQQNQFVSAYREHMSKIKEDVKKLEYQLQMKDTKIADYENEGKMSVMLKRINFLQIQEKKLLNELAKKNTEIKDAYLQNKILKSEIKNLQTNVKDLLKSKIKIQQQVSDYVRPESIPTFSTEINLEKKSVDHQSISKMLTRERSYQTKMKSMAHQRSQASDLSMNPESQDEISRLKKYIARLKKQNKQLISYSTKHIEDNAEMQNFFVETVNQIKKNIAVRKQIRECSLSDFRKQDKLQLLIKILSNDQIIIHLHEKIFGKKIKKNIGDISLEISQSQQKINALRFPQNHFPRLLSYQSTSSGYK